MDCGRTHQVRGSLLWLLHTFLLLKLSVCRVEMMIIYSKYIIEKHARMWLIETVKLVLLLMLLIIHISTVTLYTINMSFDTSPA